MERTLLLDGAAACSVPSRGPTPVKTVRPQADKYGVPRITYVNKMDRLGADFFAVLASHQGALGRERGAHPNAYWGRVRYLGNVDLITMKAPIYERRPRHRVRGRGDPRRPHRRAAEYRDTMIESTADFDEAIMEAFLGEEEIPPRS